METLAMILVITSLTMLWGTIGILGILCIGNTPRSRNRNRYYGRKRG